ncbi:malate synthase A [bacterium]|nr:malate synthase A [bacterium]
MVHAREKKSDLHGDLQIQGDLTPDFKTILTPEALAFVAEICRRFGPSREKLLQRRKETQKKIDAGEMPKFLDETREIRNGNWKVASIPAALQDRRVEITGPVDRKMVINALNSGAKVFMADFEDSHAPTWKGTMEGQINLRDAVRETISYTNPDGKKYALNAQHATLLVRPRGWHLPEKHVLLDGHPVSASLFDFGLYLFHNAKELVKRGVGPYFYIPKLENHLEARLWNEVFSFSETTLNLPLGTIRVTVLIETILAAFEMEEILYELKDYCVGLNCGRWDYIFSFIKKFKNRKDFILPDRHLVTMKEHFLKSYSALLVQTCHRRGAHAMGGMAAQIPIKNDPAANAAAMEKVSADKKREVVGGHDGTWVAHPALVEIAMKAFAEMKGANQISSPGPKDKITEKDLLTLPKGEITEQGIRSNISVSIQYLEKWIGGLGCVPLFNLMEDAATAEISRAQLWQWVHHGKLEKSKYKTLKTEELEKIKKEQGDIRFKSGNFQRAVEILDRLVLDPEFCEFLTLPAYDELEG